MTPKQLESSRGNGCGEVWNVGGWGPELPPVGGRCRKAIHHLMNRLRILATQFVRDAGSNGHFRPNHQCRGTTPLKDCSGGITSW